MRASSKKAKPSDIQLLRSVMTRVTRLRQAKTIALETRMNRAMCLSSNAPRSRQTSTNQPTQPALRHLAAHPLCLRCGATSLLISKRLTANEHYLEGQPTLQHTAFLPHLTQCTSTLSVQSPIQCNHRTVIYQLYDSHSTRRSATDKRVCCGAGGAARGPHAQRQPRARLRRKRHFQSATW